MRVNLREAMAEATLSFPGLTEEDINAGLCFKWATIVFDLVEGSKIAGHNIHAQGHAYGHTWIEVEGRCYDAECPEGVMDWRELPFFQRVLQ